MEVYICNIAYVYFSQRGRFSARSRVSSGLREATRQRPIATASSVTALRMTPPPRQTLPCIGRGRLAQALALALALALRVRRLPHVAAMRRLSIGSN